MLKVWDYDFEPFTGQVEASGGTMLQTRKSIVFVNKHTETFCEVLSQKLDRAAPSGTGIKEL
jgi:hypothetical protein